MQEYFQQSGIYQWMIDHQNHLAIHLVAHFTAVEAAHRTPPSVCTTRAASTRARTAADDSRPSRLTGLSKGTRRSLMWMSFVQRAQRATRHAVHERAGDALLVALHHAQRAGALLALISVKSARAGIHGGDEHEVGRKDEAAVGPADGRDAVFQRLAQRLQIGRAELATRPGRPPSRYASRPTLRSA